MQRGISRITAVLVVVVLIVVVVVGVVAGLQLSTRTGTTTTSSSLSSSSSVSIMSSNSTTASSTVLKQLSVDEASAPGSADPAVAYDTNSIELTMNAVLTLIFFSKSNYSELIPVLATSWTESPNGTTYTFNLRNNVYFSNGDPFNAYVVWYGVYRDMLMNQPVDYTYYLYFNASGVTVGDVNSLDNAQNTPNSTLLAIMENPNNAVTVLNSSAVQFHLTYPFAPFLDTLETGPWTFTDPYFVEQHGGVVANETNSFMSVNGSMVGDGPYVEQTLVPNQYTVLVANPHYWAQNITGNFILQPAIIPKITIYYKTDELTRILDLENNRVQGGIVAFNDLNSTLADGKNLYIPNTGLSSAIEWLMLDTYKFPLNNTLVREAIIEAINVSQIQQIAYGGYANSVVGPNLHGFFGYNNSILPTPYNLTNAKALLAEAGYPGGKGLPPITLSYPTSSYLSIMSQLVIADLSQIGLSVTPQQLTLSTWVAMSFSGLNGTASSATMIQYGSWSYYPDFSANEVLVDSQFGIIGTYHNSTIYNLIEQSNTELNPQLRAQQISSITQMVQHSYAFIWLTQDPDLFSTGEGFGPTVWNNCVSGMWYNAGYAGVDFNSLQYTCTPT